MNNPAFKNFFSINWLFFYLLSLNVWCSTPRLKSFIIYLQSEYIEKYQFELCSKYDREYDFDVILESVIPCRKLEWICRKHSNDVARQVETPGKSTIFVSLRLDYTMTVKLVDTARETFLV